jgi:hypothetical protein
MKLLIQAGLVLSLLAGCGNPAGPTLTGEDDLVLQVKDLDWKTLPDDQATILAAELHGHTLHLRVQYGGGCRTHRFALVAGTAIAESYPPYSLFRLAHDGDGDRCDALVTRDIRVDLAPIVSLVQRGGATALRFSLIEPGERAAGVGELLLTF